MKFAPVAFAAALTLAIPLVRAAEPPMVVHEWGTFTCLQDETGHALGAINSDDEPVPPFVHHAGMSIGNSNAAIGSRNIGIQSKWTPADYPSVTMRLETPVIYFH